MKRPGGSGARVERMPGRGLKRRRGRSAIALALGALGAGCDLSGLVDIGDSLLDPDAALLDYPGRRLVEGSYGELKIAGSAEGGGYVLARRLDREEPTVAVVPYLEGTSCEYTPAFSYDRFSSRIDIELPGALSVQVDQDETNPAFGTVRFIDFECQEVIEEVPSTVLPGPLFPGDEPTGMLARSTDGTLYLIDPESRSRTVVAPLVDYGVVLGPFLYTLEAGELVIRDDSLDVVDRFGSGIFGMVATGGERLPLVFEDATGIYAWHENEGVTTLAEGGCYLVGNLGADVVAYYEPCADRRLAVHLPADAVFGEPEAETFVTLRGPAGTVMQSLYFQGGLPTATSELAEVTVVTQVDPAVQSGALQVLTLPEDADREATEVELVAVELADGVTFGLGHGVYYTDYADGRGTLLDLERDEDDQVVGVVELAENVTWVSYGNPYSYRGILADFDGSEGRLIRLEKEDDGSVSETVLGEGVPPQSFVGDFETGLVAYVSDVDEAGFGVLTIVDELGPLEVADGVLMNEIRLLDDPHGVVFLKDSGSPDTFELHAFLIEAELDLPVADDVSEYIPIPWPSPGILYSVPAGSDSGLWFAKAR